MLDSGAGANMMSLKVMEKLGLKATRPYRNVCGFESRAIPTHGVVENVEVCLGKYPERVIHMDIVVVDVPDVWGMLLSRKFVAMLGGTLEMDLTYINVPMNDGTINAFQICQWPRSMCKKLTMILKLVKHMSQSRKTFLYFLQRIFLSLQRKILMRYNGQRRKSINNS
jgi:hypothetical protein